MTHYYEKNIVDIKKEYTEYLVTVMTPFLYEGFQSIYNDAKQTEQAMIQESKSKSGIINPGILAIFQKFLKAVPGLSSHMIEKETNRIRDLSQCSDIFDDLIKAVVKSNIVLLTFTGSGGKCKLVDEKFHQNVDSKDFVHKCYVECSRIFFDHPEIFWHEASTHEIKQNQRVMYQLMKVGIIKAIRRLLPMKQILEEYLKRDYIEDSEDRHETTEEKYRNVKDLVKRDLKGGNNEEMNKIVNSTDSDDSSMNDRFDELNKEAIDLNDIVYGRRIDETIEGGTVADNGDKTIFIRKTNENLNEYEEIQKEDNDDNQIPIKSIEHNIEIPEVKEIQIDPAVNNIPAITNIQEELLPEKSSKTKKVNHAENILRDAIDKMKVRNEADEYSMNIERVNKSNMNGGHNSHNDSEFFDKYAK